VISVLIVFLNLLATRAGLLIVGCVGSKVFKNLLLSLRSFILCNLKKMLFLFDKGVLVPSLEVLNDTESNEEDAS
jgi:hypothetical protein